MIRKLIAILAAAALIAATVCGCKVISEGVNVPAVQAKSAPANLPAAQKYAVQKQNKAGVDCEVIVDGNTQSLKTGDIVSLNSGGSIPAELRYIKVSCVSGADAEDIYEAQREGIPAASEKNPVKMSFSLSAKQTEAFHRLDLSSVKPVLVCRNGDSKAQELLSQQSR